MALARFGNYLLYSKHAYRSGELLSNSYSRVSNIAKNITVLCVMSVLLLVGVATCCIALLLMISFLRVSAVQELEKGSIFLSVGKV